MQLRLRSSLSFLTLALIPLLSACPSAEEDGHEEEVGETDSTDETADTESTSDESSSDESTSDESSSDESSSDESTETGTEETDAEETDAEETDAEETDTDETDTDETETTGDPSLNEQLCMDGCAVFADCLGGGGLPECYANCLEHHESLEGECLGFEQSLTSCIIGLTCEELDQFLEGDPEPYPCQAEEALVCQGQICEVGVGGGKEPGECSFEYDCPDEPIYEVVCDGDSCTCLEDGVEVGSCSEVIDFCAEVGELEPANACCGWEL